MDSDSDSESDIETCPRPRYIKDPVHDQVLITPRMSQFIDSAPFQRLRKIKQLGTTYYVWAGASHNRFEHCIGVAHLARKMVTHLRKRQPKLKITDRDIECVTLAGLCHDLGHGPWSHVWDGMFIPAILPDEKWTHEQGSEMMLDYLIKEKEIDIEADDVAFIKALIAGDPSKCEIPEKRYLFDIVANQRNGFDVDKFDYIQRDSLAFGDAIKLQISCLIKSAKVMEDQICYDYKDLDKVFEVFQTRHKLHKNFYNHKTAKAIEYMIVDGLKLAEPYLHIARRIRNPAEFLWLTDDLLPEIERSKDPNLQPAQAIFKRITDRKLYRQVDMKWVTWELRDFYKQLVTEQRILECAREAYDQFSQSDRDEMNEAWKEAGLTINDLTQDVIKVEQSTLHYGMKADNPLSFMKFYSKTGRNCASADGGDYSTLRPLVFAEVLLRIFTTKEEFHGIIQAGYHRIELDTLQTPGEAPESVDVEVAEGGQPGPVQGSNHIPKFASTSFVPTNALRPRKIAPNQLACASGFSVGEGGPPLSTAATPSSTSAAPSPEMSNTSPKFVMPGALVSPCAPSSKPLSAQSSNPRISTVNNFTKVDAHHGSPAKNKKPVSKKRDRKMVETEDESVNGTIFARRTRSSAGNLPTLPGDRQVSPSPVSRKQQRLA